MVDDNPSRGRVADDAPLRAILAAIEDPQPAPRPFLVVGRTGTGKTWLLHELARRVAARRPVLRSAESLVHEYLGAIEVGMIERFRQKISAVPVLLIDDVDYLAGRPATQEGLSQVLDDGGARGQVIVATVRSADAIDEFLAGCLRGARVLKLMQQQTDRMQVLVSDLAPYVTGPEPIRGTIDALSATSAGSVVAARLEEARAALASLDEAGLGVPAARYLAIAGALRELPATVDLARLFQVDLFKPAPDATLGGPLLAAYVCLSHYTPAMDAPRAAAMSLRELVNAAHNAPAGSAARPSKRVFGERAEVDAARLVLQDPLAMPPFVAYLTATHLFPNTSKCAKAPPSAAQATLRFVGVPIELSPAAKRVRIG